MRVNYLKFYRILKWSPSCFSTTGFIREGFFLLWCQTQFLGFKMLIKTMNRKAFDKKVFLKYSNRYFSQNPSTNNLRKVNTQLSCRFPNMVMLHAPSHVTGCVYVCLISRFSVSNEGKNSTNAWHKYLLRKSSHPINIIQTPCLIYIPNLCLIWLELSQMPHFVWWSWVFRYFPKCTARPWYDVYTCCRRGGNEG